jgi:murein DD-endopeptidase MepM/ murein hydrolase activator NlpD
MRGVRLRRGLLLLCIVALGAAAVPSMAQAGNGGAAAPAGGGTVIAGKKKASKSKPDRKSKAKAKRQRQRRAKPRRRSPVTETGHVFPVAGPYDLGGEDSRFGARRRGHSHQGQDLAAAEGTPVVAPYAASVEFVRFQRHGAGWYIVLDGDGEDRDYVFMHLRRGSITVEAGQQVAAGQPIAQVGNTGSSTGPHLHFEIWVGGWYDGGEPIDPLPLLLDWAGLLDG